MHVYHPSQRLIIVDIRKYYAYNEDVIVSKALTRKDNKKSIIE